MNNIHQGMNDIHQGGKKKINVLVPIGAVPLVSKTVIGGKTQYTGLFYRIWQQMKPQLEDRYEFEEHFVEQTEQFEYEDQIKAIGEGKYDIGLNDYSVTADRLKYALFSQPILVERNSILHYPRKDYWTSMFTLISDSFIKPFLIILVISILLGWILNKLEPGRWTSTLIPKKFYLRKTILVIISIIFGQGGLLEGKSLHSTRGIILILLTLFISTVFFFYLQAVITDKVIEINKHYNLTIRNVGDVTYLVSRGDAIKNQFDKLDMHVKVIDYAGEAKIDYYKKNKDKYGGILMSSMEALYYQSKNPDLTVSDRTFGYVPVHFAINKKTIPFIDHVNEALATLHTHKNVINVCKMYSEYQDPDLCNI